VGGVLDVDFGMASTNLRASPNTFFFKVAETNLRLRVAQLALNRIDLCVKSDDLILGGHLFANIGDIGRDRRRNLFQRFR
jgi:hypothetical protein